jgi:hypothetical protein
MEKKQKFLTIRISQELLEDMRKIAKQHTRSLNGEILVALQEYAAKNQPEQKGEGKG